MDALERLENPPICEVVCGAFFDPVPQLDVLVVGAFWKELRSEFPLREVRQAVNDNPLLLSPLPMLRGLFFSQDRTSVVQLQTDRFYVNWRRATADQRYPRFSDTEGPRGVRSQLVERFEQLRNFLSRELSVTPQVRRIELAKVDILAEGSHWKGFRDLGQMLPCLAPFAEFSTEDDWAIALRFDEPRPVGTLSVTVETIRDQEIYPGSRAVKLETRITLDVSSTEAMAARFGEASTALNRVFARLIPEAERKKRFKGEVRS